MYQSSFKDRDPRPVNNVKNVLYSMEFLLYESNKSMNIKIFYRYVFFKKQSFWLVLI